MEVEFVVPGTDGPPTFDALEEVFNAMPEPVVAAMEGGRRCSIGARRDRRRCAFCPQRLSKRVRVISLVGYDPLSCRHPDLVRSFDVGAVPGSQCELQRSAMGIDQSRQLGVEPTLGAADGMSTLPARRIGSVLMDFDVRCVEGTKRSMSIRSQCVEDLRPNSREVPPAPTGIYRLPRTEEAGEIPPGPVDSNSENHAFHHQAIIIRRGSSTRALSRYRYRDFRALVNFLSRSKSGSVKVRRGGDSMSQTPFNAISTNVLFNNTDPSFLNQYEFSYGL